MTAGGGDLLAVSGASLMGCASLPALFFSFFFFFFGCSCSGLAGADKSSSSSLSSDAARGEAGSGSRLRFFFFGPRLFSTKLLSFFVTFSLMAAAPGNDDDDNGFAARMAGSAGADDAKSGGGGPCGRVENDKCCFFGIVRRCALECLPRQASSRPELSTWSSPMTCQHSVADCKSSNRRPFTPTPNLRPTHAKAGWVSVRVRVLFALVGLCVGAVAPTTSVAARV